METIPEPSLFTTILLLRFQELVRRELDNSATLYGYTPHGLSHIQGVEASIDYLCTFIDPAKRLSALELALLRFCAWSHDLGMIRTIADKYQAMFSEPASDLETLRKDHDKASAHFLQEAVPEAFKQLHKDLNEQKTKDVIRDDLLNQLIESGHPATAAHLDFFRDKANLERWGNNAVSLAHTVALVARYHRRAEPIERAHAVRFFLGEPVRVRFLAALFRLADALHIDRTRFEQSGYDMLAESPQFSEESRVHWIKSFIISSIRIDEAEHVVHVQADIPAEIEGKKARAGIPSDRLESMLTYIVNDLKDDVVSVSRILLKEGLPSILGVTYDVHEIPAMQYPQDVRTALNHLLAMSSPNTSRLSTIALDVLRWHLDDSAEHNQSVQALQKKIERQISSLAEQLRYRPCHEALWKMHDLLGAVYAASKGPFTMLHQHNGQWRTLYALLEGVHLTFCNQRNKVRDEKDKQALIEHFADCSDIVVYGFSDQVLLLLKALKNRFDPPPQIHVLECRTKTTYAAAGDLVYLDGQMYARAIAKDVQYPGLVTLEPDAALGRILANVEPDKHAVVLMGSNAIYPDGTFVHSMGHLTVAAVAKAAARCDVIVLTDSTKIGFHRLEHPTQERHRDTWLTHKKDVIDGLKEAGVQLHNWQEDTVPMELIDKLLVLDGAQFLRSRSYSALVEARFDAPGRFSETLSVRMLASYLSFMHAAGWLPEAVKREIEDKKKLKEKEDVNLGNWRVAEAYVNKTALPAEVRDWIGNAWYNQAAPEIEWLREAIKNEYQALVDRRKPKKKGEPERRSGEVVPISEARFAPLTGETPPVPALPPPPGDPDDPGLVKPSPGA